MNTVTQIFVEFLIFLILFCLIDPDIADDIFNLQYFEINFGNEKNQTPATNQKLTCNKDSCCIYPIYNSNSDSSLIVEVNTTFGDFNFIGFTSSFTEATQCIRKYGYPRSSLTSDKQQNQYVAYEILPFELETDNAFEKNLDNLTILWSHNLSNSHCAQAVKQRTYWVYVKTTETVFEASVQTIPGSTGSLGDGGYCFLPYIVFILFCIPILVCVSLLLLLGLFCKFRKNFNFNFVPKVIQFVITFVFAGLLYIKYFLI